MGMKDKDSHDVIEAYGGQQDSMPQPESLATEEGGSAESGGSVREGRMPEESASDFERVLIDGILGFALSFGNAILFVIGAIKASGTFVEGVSIVVLFALVAALLFKIVQLNTDFISKHGAHLLYAVCHCAFFSLALVALFLNIPFLGAMASAAALADTMVLYGRFLAALARSALLLVVEAAFLYPGIMILVLGNESGAFSVVALSVMVVISMVAVFLFIHYKYDFGELISAEDSRKRSIKVKGNVQTVFLVGFMIAALLLFLEMSCSQEITVIALSATFIFASIASLVLRTINERGSKDGLRRTMAFTVSVLLLPLVLVPDPVKLLLLVAYGCYFFLESITIIDAIIETIRFNLIAAMWLIGKECSVLFLGLAVGAGLFYAVPLLDMVVGQSASILCICIVEVVFCALMQIRVNYQVYPFEGVIEEPVDEETTAQIERVDQQKELWSQRVEAVCEQYKLSPREREILPILLRGRDSKYIMDTFCISQSTAKTHIYNIYRKFGIHYRQELLDLVEDIEFYGLVKLPDDDAAQPGQDGQDGRTP